MGKCAPEKRVKDSHIRPQFCPLPYLCPCFLPPKSQFSNPYAPFRPPPYTTLHDARPPSNCPRQRCPTPPRLRHHPLRRRLSPPRRPSPPSRPRNCHPHPPPQTHPPRRRHRAVRLHSSRPKGPQHPPGHSPG